MGRERRGATALLAVLALWSALCCVDAIITLPRPVLASLKSRATARAARAASLRKGSLSAPAAQVQGLLVEIPKLVAVGASFSVVSALLLATCWAVAHERKDKLPSLPVATDAGHGVPFPKLPFPTLPGLKLSANRAFRRPLLYPADDVFIRHTLCTDVAVGGILQRVTSLGLRVMAALGTCRDAGGDCANMIRSKIWPWSRVRSRLHEMTPAEVQHGGGRCLSRGHALRTRPSPPRLSNLHPRFTTPPRRAISWPCCFRFRTGRRCHPGRTTDGPRCIARRLAATRRCCCTSSSMGRRFRPRRSAA